MRHISETDVKACLPDDWEQEAESALKNVQDIYDADPNDQSKRATAINNNPLWGKLRTQLAELRNNKCWYCESVIKRSHKPIDHYRPKSAVKESPDHGGYWWLAYDWKNYRLCCTYCNVYGTEGTRGIAGGKGSEFPIWDEAHREMSPGNCSNEQPLLLDPFKKADTSLLWFEHNGNVIPHPRRCRDKSSFPYKRAEASIRIYNLLEDDLKENRGTLCDDIEKIARNADKYYAKYSEGDATAYDCWEENLERLSRAVDKDAEYSRAAIHTLMHIRNDCETADTILEDCLGG